MDTDQKKSKRCVFPFSFKGKSYVDCTKDHSSNGVEWCATEVNKNGEVENGQWGDCDREAVSCFVVGTSSNRVQPRPTVSGETLPLIVQLKKLECTIIAFRGSFVGDPICNKVILNG